MLRAGQKEIDAVAKVVRSGKLFRYGKGSQCERFEQRYAKYLGVKHALMCSSGTSALTAALAGLGIGPGDEVIVPCHTYMATAVAVLAVGAIPVVVDIDESLVLSPEAFEDAIGPCTKAVIPVHLWGMPCDMSAIMRIARKRKLLVIEDACQAVGGGYEGKMLGSIGHMGAFSFNYFKNMTCGEGGAVVSDDDKAFERVRCMIDCCGMYWAGRRDDFQPFISAGSRASEIEGAVMNAQLDQIRGMIAAMRRQKKRVLRETAKTDLTPAKCNSLDYECGTHTAFLLSTAKAAKTFQAATKIGFIASGTGRHVYTEWDPLFAKQGAHHPALNPFKLPQNRKCRKRYSKDMCRRSLDILDRAVLIPNHPDRSAAETGKLIDKLRRVASLAMPV
jgi:dTDP-4-amino-4,6-dideoxygalactose transaminase